MSPGLLLQPSQPGADASSLQEDLSNSPQNFLVPSQGLHSAALALAKQYLDPLAQSTSHLQETRLEESRRKRKRGKYDDGEVERSTLRLKEVYLDGFTVDGIWGQARRILEASSSEIERSLQERAHQVAAAAVDHIPSVRFDDEGFEIDSDEEETEPDEDGLLDGDDSDVGEFANGYDEDEDEQDEEGDDGLEETNDLEDIEVDSEQDFNDDDTAPPGSKRSEVFVKDKFGLNDGFFNIDEFNKDSEFLEQADERGDDDGAASDEEEVDWGMDPMTQQIAMSEPSSSKGKGKQKQKQKPGDLSNESDEEDDDENGPTFGDADLNAPWSDDEDDNEMDADMQDFDAAEDDGLDNTNDIGYEDFFEPPPRALMKTKRMRALPKTQPQEDTVKPTDEDMQRAIDSHRRDLFDDDFSDPEADPDEEFDEEAPGMRNLSTHERRRVALAKQIRELEAASVAKRDWQLSGEATAHARPENALLEEDLDFERAGKPVPVITADVSNSIEDMIKQRILNRQFDEVIKRRPGTEVGSGFGGGQPRRGLTELSDQKDPQSLAESYEQAYLAQTDPNAKDPRSEALKAQHAEIERLWAEVSGKLDALTSWRYKPKPPGVEVRVVTDAPKILMEDARPSGVEGITDEQGGLAPQEVYRVGEDKEAGEEGVVTTRTGAVVAKEELSREQKLRRRRREKERAKKKESADAALAKAPKAKADAVPAKRSKRDEEAAVLKQLKTGGVKIIGKGGKLQDVDGQKVKTNVVAGGNAYKL